MAGTAIIVRKDNVRLFIWDKGNKVSKADKIANIVSIGDIGGDGAEEIDVTCIDSKAREYQTGFVDNGNFDAVLAIKENEYSYAKSRMDNADDIEWGISVLDKNGKQIVGLHGEGVVKTATLTGLQVSGWLQCTMNIRVSGNIDLGFVDPIGGFVVEKPVTEITVAPIGGGQASISTPLGTLQLVATIKPDDAEDKRVTWSVDDDSIATITSTGLLTAVSNGTVTAKAIARDGSGTEGTKTVTITGQNT